MTDHREPRENPAHPDRGELRSLPPELEPPTGLEDRVASALSARGLIRYREGRHADWRPWVGLVAAAVLMSVSFFVGKWSASDRPAQTGPAPINQYALLLYESDGFDRPTEDELVTRYDAYSSWVAEARRRDQFVTGEDLSVEDGFTLTPASDGLAQTTGATIGGTASLSGIFVVTAPGDDEALDLARRLPHLRYGGEVVVQRILPTDVRPQPR